MVLKEKDIKSLVRVLGKLKRHPKIKLQELAKQSGVSPHLVTALVKLSPSRLIDHVGVVCLGDELRRARGRLTQTKLGQKLGLHQTDISLLERLRPEQFATLLWRARAIASLAPTSLTDRRARLVLNHRKPILGQEYTVVRADNSRGFAICRGRDGTQYVLHIHDIPGLSRKLSEHLAVGETVLAWTYYNRKNRRQQLTIQRPLTKPA